ncbi:hypothetical protein AWC22_06830 [Mycobacterium riyadhense]|nr:hypothetical protein AWC22_06830 [Mycobacterium riyadhense]
MVVGIDGLAVGKLYLPMFDALGQGIGNDPSLGVTPVGGVVACGTAVVQYQKLPYPRSTIAVWTGDSALEKVLKVLENEPITRATLPIRP